MKNSKTNREVFVEDVNVVVGKVYETLSKQNIWFESVTHDNKFFKELSAFLEKSLDVTDYRNFN